MSITSLVLISAISIRILIVLVYIYFSYIVINKYLELKFRIFRYVLVKIIASITSFGLQIYFLIIDPILLFNNQIGIDVLAGIITAYFTLLFLNQYVSNRLNPVLTSISTLLGFIAVMSSIPGVAIGMADISQVLGLIFGYGQPIFFTYIIIVGIFLIRDISSQSGGSLNEQKYYLYILLFVIFVFMGPTIFYTTSSIIFPSVVGEYSMFQLIWFYVFPALTIHIGQYFFYFGYIGVESPSMLQPQPIQQFILINKSGLTIYQYTDDKKDTSNVDTQLFSSAISAIVTLLEESDEDMGGIRSIEVQNRFLNITQLNEYIGILFSETPTQFLRLSLDDMMNEILKILGEYSKVTSERAIDQIDQIVKFYLGYLE